MTDELKRAEVHIYPDGRLDAHNAAAYLGVAAKTLAMWRCYGTGPQFIKRGKIFYFIQDLDDWLGQAQRVSSTAQLKP